MSEIRIGPNCCPYCGGEYGEHKAYCTRPKPGPTLEERVSKLEKEVAALKRKAKR